MQKNYLAEKQGESPFVSLFEYLGKPAGKDLGKQVEAAARRQKEPILYRIVKTSTYSGKVCIYRREFLDKFFRELRGW